MNNEQQTVVDYYINATMALEIARGINNMNIKEYIANKKLIIEKAKEMEKERMIQFAKQCLDKALDLDVRTAYSRVEQYYNKIYGGNQ